METMLKNELGENLEILQSKFGRSGDFYAKKLQIGHVSCAAALFTGIASLEKLQELALKPLEQAARFALDGQEVLRLLQDASSIPAEPCTVTEWNEVSQRLSSGFALLFAEGCAEAAVLSVQEMPQRSVGMPQSEGNIRGSQEGFTEVLRTNLALLRRQFRRGTLVAEIAVADTPCATEYCLCYDKEKAPPELVRKLRGQLAAVKIPLLLDSAYFASFLKENKWNLFPAAGYTERPATAAARLAEGKLVVLVAGSPNALIVPCFFSENFESLDDYTSTAVFAGMIRIIKYLAFFLSVFWPGFHLMAVGYAPEIIPRQLLKLLAEAETSTPLPLMPEILLVVILLEIVREAGLRAPKPFGNTVSIVGGLIIGETAVSAGIISVPVLVSAAAATIATMTVPQLYEQSILFRMVCILLTGWFGVPGFTCAASLVFSMAIGTNCEGYSYLYPLVPVQPATWRDGVTRSIWSRLAQNEHTIGEMKTESINRETKE